MSDQLLDFLLPGFSITNFELQPEVITLTARATSVTSACPSCGGFSNRIHSYYTRHPKDLPFVGSILHLDLQVRRFRCVNNQCSTVTFAERLPQLVAPSAQRTLRLTANLRVLGLALGGEAGARYALQTAIPVSPDTLIRLVCQTTLPAAPTPRVLGVDDFAFRKGRNYGTILVDGETHRPIDLLADRTSQTLAKWLVQHPGIEIITRDRSTEYARGVNIGASDAVQVADRWHVLVNLREALERVLDRFRPDLQVALSLPLSQTSDVVKPISIYERETRRGTKDQLTHEASRARRYALFEKVKALQAQKRNILQIARELKISRQTVRKYLATDQFMEFPSYPHPKSILDPYAPYLQERWNAGCHDMVELWHEIQQRGYSGSIRPIVQWTTLRRERLLGGPSGKGRQPIRQVEIFKVTSSTVGKTSSAGLLPSSRRLVWLLLRPQSKLNETERMMFQNLQRVSKLLNQF